MAHTANDAVDVIDSHHNKYLRSIMGLSGVAGVLVSNDRDMVFTSNRGEKTVGIFQYGQEKSLTKVKVGGYPNGLAFDPAREHLLAANVSKPDDPSPINVSIVDTKTRVSEADIVVPGRTRWTIYDGKTDRFYVNIAKPSQIVAIDAKDPDGIAASFEIPATGPHGLDIDTEENRLFCACDQGGLFTVDLDTGLVTHASDLQGSPDVILYNQQLKHLYVTIGDPGVVEVFDTETMNQVQTLKTTLGSHTVGLNSANNKVYVFEPEGHKASVYLDGA